MALYQHAAGDDGIEVSRIAETFSLKSRTESAFYGPALFREDDDVIAGFACRDIGDLESGNRSETHHLKSRRKDNPDSAAWLDPLKCPEITMFYTI